MAIFIREKEVFSHLMESPVHNLYSLVGRIIRYGMAMRYQQKYKYVIDVILKRNNNAGQFTQ